MASSYLGRIVKRRREERKLSLEALSKLIFAETGESISKSTLQRIEAGEVMPSFEFVSCIAYTLNLDIIDLYEQTLKKQGIDIKKASIYYRYPDTLLNFIRQYGLKPDEAKEIIQFHIEVHDRINTLFNKKRKEEN